MKKRKIPRTKITQKIFINNRSLLGKSDKLNQLIEETKLELSVKIYFDDIRNHRDNPHLAKQSIVTFNPNESEEIIYLDPSQVFEDDIAHELYECRIRKKYPKLCYKKGTKSSEFLDYVRDYIYSGLIDFEVERLVKMNGFNISNSILRDKRSMLRDWSSTDPYYDFPFKDNPNWKSLRVVGVGIILSHLYEEMNQAECRLVEESAKRTIPDALAICHIFLSEAKQEKLDCAEGFSKALEDVLQKLQLSEIFEISNS